MVGGMSFYKLGYDGHVVRARCVVMAGDDVDVMGTVSSVDGPLDLTDYEAYMAITTGYGEAPVLDFSSDALAGAICAIAVGGVDGTLTFAADGEDTLELADLDYVWDLTLTNPDGRSRIIARGPAVVLLRAAAVEVVP